MLFNFMSVIATNSYMYVVSNVWEDW